MNPADDTTASSESSFRRLPVTGNFRGCHVYYYERLGLRLPLYHCPGLRIDIGEAKAKAEIPFFASSKSFKVLLNAINNSQPIPQNSARTPATLQAREKDSPRKCSSTPVPPKTSPPMDPPVPATPPPVSMPPATSSVPRRKKNTRKLSIH